MSTSNGASVKKRSGRTNCCVVGCSNKYENTANTVSFYMFPPDNYISRSRREQWITNVKRVNEDGSPWIPGKLIRICSEHFVGGKKNEHPHHPAYVPTIFPTHKQSAVLNDFRFQRLTARKNKLKEKEECTLDTDSDVGAPSNPSIISTAEIGCQTDDLDSALYTNVVSEKNFYCCFYIKESRTDINSETQTDFIREEHSDSTKNKKCGPNLEDLKNDKPGRFLECDGFHGFNSVKEENQLVDLTGVKKEVFTFLLALFSLHRTTVSKIFFDVLENLAYCTKDFIHWPSKDTVVQTLPKCFKINYPNCRVIIDCTEFKIQQPAKISDRINVYSHYKGTYTSKALIGIAPTGLITYISPIYGGKASDVQITTECGILDKLEPGDIVLADKGFPGIKIEDRTLIIIPPFLHNGKLSEDEVDKCYNIASVRIHVERAIGRMKIFHILQNRIPTLFFPYLNDIVHVICVLVNLMSPLIKE